MDQHDTPTLAGYVLWATLIIALLWLAHSCGALSDIEARDPAEGTHMPDYFNQSKP